MLTDKQVAANEQKIKTLTADTQMKVRQLLAMLAAKGLYFAVTLALRSVADQDKLYSIGRTKPGDKVTNARGGYSWHNFGRAVDLVLVRDGGTLEWQPMVDTDHDGMGDYRQMGEAAKSLGFVWGGDFKGLGDFGHVEYHPGITLADARAKAGITV